MTLTVALTYGGRAEIVAAVRAIAAQVAAGELDAEAVDEDHALARHLFTAGMPDPDLLIRTSGEQRISNFLLWQCAYSELVFTRHAVAGFRQEPTSNARSRIIACATGVMGHRLARAQA